MEIVEIGLAAAYVAAIGAFLGVLVAFYEVARASRAVIQTRSEAADATRQQLERLKKQTTQMSDVELREAVERLAATMRRVDAEDAARRSAPRHGAEGPATGRRAEEKVALEA